jgi:DNA-directed RNA polymerase I, II, and III subunit RPABC5
MIIPIKCFTCGTVLADKYRYYCQKVREIRNRKIGENKDESDFNNVIYLTSEKMDKTPEGIILDELNLTKMCCRRHMLTHVDME